MSNHKNQELLQAMELCGHFLHHRRGGKKGQTRILKLLVVHGEIAQKDLQDMLGIRSGSISETIAKLESSGLIVRKKDDADKRKYIIRITEEGKDILYKNRKKYEEEGQKLFDDLTEEESNELHQLLFKLLHSWQISYDKSLFHHKGNLDALEEVLNNTKERKS